MKIYTKTGDTGQTSLIGGERVAKDDARVEACGTVDELNATVGVAHSLLSMSLDDVAADLLTVQHRLFDIGAELASLTEKKVKALKVPQATAEKVEQLEKQIDTYDKELDKLTNFILPGGSQAAAALHQARAVCRRAERRVINLHGSHPVNPELVKYLNRLSDYLFTVARLANHRGSAQDILWQKAD